MRAKPDFVSFPGGVDDELVVQVEEERAHVLVVDLEKISPLRPST